MRIDFHTHILPGIDDGSRSIAESVKMLQMEREQGITHVVATPHFYAARDHLDEFLSRRQKSEELLRREMEKYPDCPEIIVGSEVHFFRGISTCDDIFRLTIDNKSSILLEMPVLPWSPSVLNEVGLIYERQGITPIIAHIDRYIRPFQARHVLKMLADMPVLIQANAGFFQRAETQRLAMRMLRNQKIHLLGSDCHGASYRVPNLGQTHQLISKRLGENYNQYVDQNGARLLENM